MLDPAILAVVAKAIVGHAVGESSRALSGRAKRLLRGDPVERAIAGAMGDALVDLERAHPDAVAGLFDEVFLKSDRAASVLAHCLVPGDVPTAEHLAAAWLAHTGAAAGDRYAGDVIESAAECLLAAFDSALDERERQNVLGELRAYRANRVSSDAISQFASWTGSQRRRSRIDPQQRYVELDLSRFAGRAWLVEEVDAFLRECDGGYFELEGAAGLGKSTVLAWLARERGYPVHFVRLARGGDDTTAALSNLAVQLADAWEVEGPVSLYGPDVEPHEFYELLAAIARTRERRGRTDPVVIVIDGLDEVRSTHERGNVLGLPARPPDGVYFIVSRRPAHVDLSVHSRRCCALRTDDERHRHDLRAYLTTACTRPKIAAALRYAQLSDEELTGALMDKSAGVWLYAHHVLSDIERGACDVSKLDDLPVGLWEFYEENVRARARDAARWQACELALLGTLAAAQEPLSRPTLARLAGVEDGAAVDDVIEAWAAFLERDGAPPHRLYHDSLRRFFADDAGAEPTRSPSQRRLASRLAEATREAHDRIAEHYLQLWGGLSNGLPGLRDTSCAMADEGYGVRQLGAHFEIRERYDDLRALLQAEWTGAGPPSCAWFETHAEAGDHTRYLIDVARARRLAEGRTDRALAAGRPTVSLADEYGYALLAGSTRSHSTTIAPQLRRALVRRGIWSVTRAVADVRQLIDQATGGVRLASEPSPISRAAALAALAEYLNGDQLDEALAAARAIDDEHERARVLAALAKHLDAVQLNDALHDIRAIGNDATRADALTVLAGQLDGDQRERALDLALHAARQIAEDSKRARALTVLAGRLDADRRGRALDDAWRAARQVADASSRVDALVALSEHLDADQHERAVREALQAARVGNEYQRAGSIADLARHLDADQLKDALLAARAIGNKDARARALAALAWVLDADQREYAIDGALHAISIDHVRPDALVGRDADELDLPPALIVIGDEVARAGAIAALAGHLDADQLSAALRAASAIGFEYARGRALAALARHLDADQLKDAVRAVWSMHELDLRASTLAAFARHLDADQLTDALQGARAVGDANAIGVLAPHLGADQLTYALQAARAIGDEPMRAGALAALAEHLDADHRKRALNEALRAAAAARGGYDRAVALAALAEQLDADQLSDALDVAAAIGNDDARAVALGALAEYLDADQLNALGARAIHLDTDQLSDALRAACAIGSDHARAEALGALAMHLDTDQLGDALRAACAIGSDRARAYALAALAIRLDTGQLSDALRAACAIGNDHARAYALAALAMHLDTDQLRDALRAACAIGSDHARADQLVEFAEFRNTLDVLLDGPDALQALFDVDHVSHAMQAASAAAGEDARIRAIVALVAQLLLDAPKLSVQAKLLTLWRDAVHAAESRGRPSVLAVAASTGRMLHWSGGSDGVASVAAWIGATSRWWP